MFDYRKYRVYQCQTLQRTGDGEASIWMKTSREEQKQTYQSSPFLVERRLLGLVWIKQLVLLNLALFFKSCQCIFYRVFFFFHFFGGYHIVSSAQWCSIKCRKSEELNVKLKAQSRLYTNQQIHAQYWSVPSVGHSSFHFFQKHLPFTYQNKKKGSFQGYLRQIYLPFSNWSSRRQLTFLMFSKQIKYQNR